MPNLKDLKNRIASVQSTRKITSAMKMVAASKLRRAQEQAEAGRPYAERMGRMLASLAANVQDSGNGPKLMTGTGSDQVHLLVIISSDRGLCGAFNGAIVRESRRQIQRLQSEGKTVKLLTVGRKARDQLRREFGSLIVETYEDVGRRKLSFADADVVAQKVLAMYDAGEFDVCSVIFNKFKSAISQIVTVQQLVPFAVEAQADEEAAGAEVKAIYEFEPDEEQILAELLPRNLSIQVYRALLESAASEQGARMTAMDNATRNAGDMINKLTITYNRTRQAYITKELIEIISGAEAV
ncbi:F0F1 ATP synthase subunit gamma [Azospirillum baldaniorum]|uniref:ATP synthase gamma chain n=2 Tax=Azospirillum TaxID=191 RepID=A0A9P1JP94_9PROT|nr:MULTISPECIES: F0F1 ATP synthase subunit gamma [Azospirillum]AWJ90662.1 F0F1 ATP synthase subunit gamma [Azospirillum baldaniorum]NUB10421.1 F0F1 ATP synthase subunit gamma [Azospirillum baldaniorum]TWA69471.1 ATP synthase F1 subcomplex gamma subunit [Azospirillum baldaniorum]TWA78881.1 ATP synthase F1 subcomplex gamma subunit [Azospirillum brasilense]UKJ73486.1 F0F1 ATP synthase subunit gamma [Azospirillum brasilense]